MSFIISYTKKCPRGFTSSRKRLCRFSSGNMLQPSTRKQHTRTTFSRKADMSLLPNSMHAWIFRKTSSHPKTKFPLQGQVHARVHSITVPFLLVLYDSQNIRTNYVHGILTLSVISALNIIFWIKWFLLKVPSVKTRRMKVEPVRGESGMKGRSKLRTTIKRSLLPVGSPLQ